MPDSLDPQLPLPRPPISRGAMLLGCLGTFVVIVLLGGSSIWLYLRGRHQQAARAVQAEVASIHAAGEPITSEDMDKFHRVPEHTFDATPLWMDAIQSAVAVKDPSEPQLPIVGDGMLTELQADAPQSLLPLAQQYLAAHGETIDKTRKAAAAGGQCRYPIKFADGINALLPHIQDARKLARLLSLRLHVAVEAGDVPAAIESLELELALAATLDHEPTLIAQLVRIAVLGIALDDVALLVGDVPLSDLQLASLQKKIEAIDVQRPVKDGLFGERALGYLTFHQLSQIEGMEMIAGEDGKLQRPGDCRVYLGFLREMIEAADESPAQARVTVKQIENKLIRQIGTQNPLERLETVVTAQLLPATGKVFDASARLQALRDSAAAGIAFRRYQLKHGQPPASLSALVPEFLAAVPSDPFAAGNSPLILVIDGDQFAIYSVGANGRDDKVLLADPDSQDDNGFVARLEVPPTSPAGGKE